MSKLSFLSSFLAFSLLFGACSAQKSDSKESNEIESTKNVLPKDQIILTDTTNNQYKLKKLKDGFKLEDSNAEILILDVFATWCPPCQAEASHLSSLQKKYPKSIKIIGITIEDNIPNEKLEAFKKAHNAEYTLVNSAQNRVIINDLASMLKLGSNFGIPLLAIYKDGKLIRFYQGAVEEEFIDSDIKRALGK